MVIPMSTFFWIDSKKYSQRIARRLIAERLTDELSILQAISTHLFACCRAEEMSEVSAFLTLIAV